MNSGMNLERVVSLEGEKWVTRLEISDQRWNWTRLLLGFGPDDEFELELDDELF